MPSNDDTPKLEPLLGGTNLLAADATDTADVQRGDYLQIWDNTSGQLKRITIQEFGESLNLVFI